MKKILLRILTILIYITAMLFLTEFKPWILIDIKMMLMVAFGTTLLTLSNYKKGMTFEELKAPACFNAMLTAYLTTFILLFSRLSNNSQKNLLSDVAMNCRPMLYGLIINILLKNNLQKVDIEDFSDNRTVTNSNTELDINKEIDSYAEIIMQKLRYSDMTDREIEIALFICKGLSNKEIGDKLFISENTIKKHTSNFYKKINISNREQLKQYIERLVVMSTHNDSNE